MALALLATARRSGRDRIPSVDNHRRLTFVGELRQPHEPTSLPEATARFPFARLKSIAPLRPDETTPSTALRLRRSCFLPPFAHQHSSRRRTLSHSLIPPTLYPLFFPPTNANTLAKCVECAKYGSEGGVSGGFAGLQPTRDGSSLLMAGHLILKQAPRHPRRK